MKHTQLLIGGGLDAVRSIGIDQFFDYLQQQSAIGGDVTNAQTAFANVTWVYRCTNMRAQSVAGIPFVVLDAADNEIEWEFADGMRHWLYYIEAALCLRGASYLLKLKNRFGHKGFQWLNPFTVEPIVDKRDGLVAFEQLVSGSRQRFEPDDVIYHHLFNPTRDLGPGIAPAAVALAAAQTADNTNEYLSRFFGQGAIPAVILTSDQRIDEQEARRVKRVWERLFSGVRKAFGTAVLQRGLKPEIIGSKVGDLDVEPIFAQMRQQIAVAFGIPQTMLEDAANFATAREHKLSFYYETIFPECDLIAAGLNQQFFTQQNQRFEFRFQDVEAVQQDEATKATQVGQLFQLGIITADEAREQLGYEPTAASEPAPEPEPVPESETEPEPVKAVPIGKEVLAELAKWRRRVKRGTIRRFESDIIPAWLQTAIRLRLADPRFASSALDPCVRALDRSGAETSLQRKLTQALDEALSGFTPDLDSGQVPDLEPLNNALLSVLTTALTSIVADQMLALAVEHGLGLDYGNVLIDAAEWARRYAGRLVKDLETTSKKHLQAVISQLTNGEITHDAAVELLQPMFGKARAESIAVTEVTSAFSAAESQYAKRLRDAGIEIQERWLTAEDDRVCPICAPLDHTLKPVWGQQFPGGPPAHPNCRCAVVIERVT